MTIPSIADPETLAPSFEPPVVKKESLAKRFWSNDYIIRVLSVVLGLSIWELIGSHYPYSMSSPWNVLRAMKQYLFPQIVPAAWQTLQTFSLGFAICVVAGIPIGLAMARAFGREGMSMGVGGTIPFMAMLGERFPSTQFLVTGVLGPHSNAHGPNEFLHIDYAKRLTGAVADVLARHAQR